MDLQCPRRHNRLMRRLFLLLCLPLCLLANPAMAQTNPPPAYEGPLLRLSELMGALHYLRGLCGAGDVDAWREKMSAFIESVGSDMARRERLAGAFNRGYRTFQQSYRGCNASARATIRAYLAESGQIARDVGARYGQ